MATALTSGEEFRDDRRRRPSLTRAQLEQLTTLDPLRSTLAVLTTVGIIVLTLVGAVHWWSPWVIALAVVVIATQQQACFVLAHDAAHYRLFATRWLNDLVGRALAIAPGISMCTYRVVHRLHHNHLYERRDPDVPLIAGYPRGRAYLVKKLLTDLCGVTAPKTYAYFFGAPAINDDAESANRPLDDTAPKLRRAARRDRWLVICVHAIVLALCVATGYVVEYLVLWVLPAVTVLQALLRLRAVCEHGAVSDLSSPLTAARTNLVPWWMRWLFPHHVNYHVEHHLFPAVPHYRLPECHRVLSELGALEHAEIRPVFDTMRRIAADPAVGR